MAVATTVVLRVMDAIPSSTDAYAHVAYWERRFEEEQGHEWFGGYAQFRHLVQPHIAPEARILILGNGTSSLPYDLQQDGYHRITATDICPNVVHKMQRRHASVVFEVADMCALPYEDGRFDVVIEKGTLDVLFTEAPSLWQPPAAVCERMDTACNEIRRVLSPTGRLFSITFTQPHFRRPFFHRNGWSCHVDTFGDKGCLEYFVYRLHKMADSVPQRSSSPSRLDTQAWTMEQDPMHTHLDEESFLFSMEDLWQ